MWTSLSNHCFSCLQKSPRKPRANIQLCPIKRWSAKQHFVAFVVLLETSGWHSWWSTIFIASVNNTLSYLILWTEPKNNLLIQVFDTMASISLLTKNYKIHQWVTLLHWFSFFCTTNVLFDLLISDLWCIVSSLQRNGDIFKSFFGSNIY